MLDPLTWRNVSQLHDRMPVVIAPENRERWLKGENPAELLKPYPSELMTMWPVSPNLNSVKNDSPELLERWDEPQAPRSGEVRLANEGDADREPTNSE